MNAKKISSIVLLVIVMLNFLSAAFTLIPWSIFWIITTIAAFFTYVVLPRIK